MTKRSSTFSFDAVPRLGHTALWVVVLAVAALVGLEVTARALGHRPSVFDDDELFCMHWDRLHEPDVFAILGSSRSRAGFSAQAFSERYPGRALANVASPGACPLAALAELARDEQFTGTVLYDVAEGCLVRELRTQQQARIARCSNTSLGRSLNRWVRLQLEPLVVLMHPRVGLDNLVKSLWQEHAFPAADYYATSPERLNKLDFSVVGAELGKTRVARLQQEYRLHPPAPPERWLEEARLTETYIRRIQNRGGRVYVVRFPTSGEFWRLEQGAYPRERYWNAFAALSEARFIHFQDLPTRTLECGDQSHLDARDAPAFTRALLDEMAKQEPPRTGGPTK